MHGTRDLDALDVEQVLEQAACALRCRVEIMMWEPMQGLQKRYAAIKPAAALQDARNLRRAAEGIAHMFQNRDREDGIERVAFERQMLTDADDVVES
jgi:hypothetical protein